MQAIETQKYWFVARIRNKQEFAIRKHLESLKTNNNLDIDYYLPTRIVVSQLKYRRKRSEVPIIRNLIFIYATKQLACDLSNIYGVRVFYMEDQVTKSMLIVPLKQMEDFIFVMDLDPDRVCLDKEYLIAGHKVKVIKGDFSGIEGDIANVSNKTYVIISIKDILTASIKVPKSYLKIIKQ